MKLKDLDGKKLKVSNRFYVIKVKKSIQNGELLGRSEHGNEVIKICSDQSEDSLADTLLHEILHCIWYTSAIGYALDGEQTEEFVVSVLSSALMAVFYDNPWLYPYLNKIIQKGS